MKRDKKIVELKSKLISAAESQQYVKSMKKDLNNLNKFE